MVVSCHDNVWIAFFLGTPAHRSKFEADLQQTARQRGAGEVSWFSQVLMMTPLFFDIRTHRGVVNHHFLLECIFFG